MVGAVTHGRKPIRYQQGRPWEHDIPSLGAACGTINVDGLAEDRYQLFAEAVHTGCAWWPEREFEQRYIVAAMYALSPVLNASSSRRRSPCDEEKKEKRQVLITWGVIIGAAALAR